MNMHQEERPDFAKILAHLDNDLDPMPWLGPTGLHSQAAHAIRWLLEERERTMIWMPSIKKLTGMHKEDPRAAMCGVTDELRGYRTELQWSEEDIAAMGSRTQSPPVSNILREYCNEERDDLGRAGSRKLNTISFARKAGPTRDQHEAANIEATRNLLIAEAAAKHPGETMIFMDAHHAAWVKRAADAALWAVILVVGTFMLLGCNVYADTGADRGESLVPLLITLGLSAGIPAIGFLIIMRLNLWWSARKGRKP